MDFSDGYIYVDYAHATGAIDDMETESRAIMGILNELQMELAPLQQSWIGEDKAVYEDVQKKWDNAVANIQNLLSQHAVLLGDIATNYKQTEQNGSQRWGEITIGAR
ncbi:WXG100 family type VII secretion target [Streptomyces tendae]|uniref:WXG100 family type VII secretion target n=1 Tax=Streptomyces tendae TaxID=1932 RepID=UPI0037A67FFA